MLSGSAKVAVKGIVPFGIEWLPKEVFGDIGE
jgi:hypothetical protein